MKVKRRTVFEIEKIINSLELAVTAMKILSIEADQRITDNETAKIMTLIESYIELTEQCSDDLWEIFNEMLTKRKDASSESAADECTATELTQK